ncbi:MAG TPA: stage II sporulation protein P, partial [Clostridiales bacterium]|nr:stage II sporulation protein P [Clostridiales bacterium]
MKKMINRALIPILLLLFLIPIPASADDWFEPEPGYYTLLDENEKELTVMGWEVSLKDEYVSSDNKHYIVTRVDSEKKTAYTRLLGEVPLPAVQTQPESREAAQQDKGNILLYCTHNDESYVPTDGKESIKGNGGIFDVAEALQANLKKKGIDAVLSRDRHDPHDAGSYRRSRRTAVNLMKKNVP